MEWVLIRHQLIHEDSASWNKCPFCVYVRRFYVYIKRTVIITTFKSLENTVRWCAEGSYQETRKS